MVWGSGGLGGFRVGLGSRIKGLRGVGAFRNASTIPRNTPCNPFLSSLLMNHPELLST